MKDYIKNLIQDYEKKSTEGSFTIKKNNIETADGNRKHENKIYSEGDLTKNYVSFVKDIFNEFYGTVRIRTIEALGDSIKSSFDNFSESYKNKKSVIKKISDGVFIHTSMNKEMMMVKIKNLAESIGADLELSNEKNHKLTHGGILADDIINNDNVFKRLMIYQIEREHLEDELNKKVTPLEFKRFCEDIDSHIMVIFINMMEDMVKEWSENNETYSRVDYLD
jgi:hypothetical protein